MSFKRFCPEACPGCAHRNQSAEESIGKKYDFLKKKLFRWADILEPVRATDNKNRFNYRRKVCLHSFYNDDHWEFGMISRKQFIAIPACPVQHEIICRAIDLLSYAMPPASRFPVHFFIQSGNQVMLVVKTHIMPDVEWMNDKLKEELKNIGIEGLWLHLNPSAGNKIFMKHNFFLLFGGEFSVDDQGLHYGPMSFQQLIPELYNNSLKCAHEYLKPGSADIIMDLYCGIGYSMRSWLQSGTMTAGVELNGEAVECCLKNVPGAVVLRGKCSDRIPQINKIANENTGKRRLLYVNPPRTGLEKEVLQWIVSSYQPERMAYLSCSAGTLARDLSFLVNAGYKVSKIIPYDFFPQTHHVECLTLIEKS